VQGRKQLQSVERLLQDCSDLSSHPWQYRITGNDNNGNPLVVQLVHQAVGHFALEIDIDSSETRFLLSRQSECVSRCCGWPIHLHTFGFKERLQGVCNVPMVLHNEDARTLQM
jgi:hypothetical protein